MSRNPCKVLTEQIEGLKRYQTGLREMIGVLSDLADRRTTIPIAAAALRTAGYGILAVVGVAAGGAGLAGKQLVGKVLTAAGAGFGISSLRRYCKTFKSSSR